MTIVYTLDGGPEQQLSWTSDGRWKFGTVSADVQKKFFMPGIRKDDPVKLSIKKVYSQSASNQDLIQMQASAATLQKYQNYAIQRNNTYQIDLDMIPNEAK